MGSTAYTQIRRLAPADAAEYRSIRLEALKCSPEAFGSTFEEEHQRARRQPLTWYADLLSRSAMLGAFRGPELVGIAGLSIGERQKEAHKGELRFMYVKPGSRRAGVGRRLVETIIEIARQRIELLQLTVVSDSNARRLYESLGFLEYGFEKNGLKYEGRYYDQVLMAMDLRPQRN